jgi:hypothetical protein
MCYMNLVLAQIIYCANKNNSIIGQHWDALQKVKFIRLLQSLE